MKMKGDNDPMMRLAFVVLLAMASVPAATAQSAVFRCGRAYQAEPCVGGTRVNTQAAVRSSAHGADKTTIYLCKAYNGRAFWTTQNCYARGGATVERTVDVPRELSWDEQVRMAEGARIAAEGLQRTPTRRRAHRAPVASSHCTALAQALQTNESALRAGGSARRMDKLTAQRHQLWAQQSAAGCR